MKLGRSWIVLGAVGGLLMLPGAATVPLPSLRVVVTSPEDTIAPDAAMTLREAIELVNGTLLVESLSPMEQAFVSRRVRVPLEEWYAGRARPRIEFQLAAEQTTIRLRSLLPPLVQPGTVIDGATQPGYRADAEGIPSPIVRLEPVGELFRGLTIAASGVTIRGLSLAGFNAQHDRTEGMPPADIFIAQAVSEQRPRDIVRDIVIEQNWLGVAPVAGRRSAFGVSVFNSAGTTIRRNWIANHDGSGILTAVQALNLQITANRIERNGLAGMPDAIRLEGQLANVRIEQNQIEQNAGSAVYIFKPDQGVTRSTQGLAQGVTIAHNRIAQNGQRYRRAAIYLMGHDHRVIENQITDQVGAGVVVAAYPPSWRNQILGNQFDRIRGLCIDLVSQQHVGPQDYQQGDGLNPLLHTRGERLKTGNLGLDAPRFLSSEFFVSPIDGSVEVAGLAQPAAIVELYRLSGTGNLHQSIARIPTTANGRFTYQLGTLQAGDRLSATVTQPQSGTSEPARTVLIRGLP